MTRNSAPVGTYKYDGRALRTVKTTNSETTLFIYDKEGRLIAEADSQGNVLKEYVYLNGQVLVPFQYNPAAQATSSTPVTGVSAAVEAPASLPAQKTTSQPSVSIASATSSEIAASLVPVYYLLLLNKETSADGAWYYINDHLGTPQIITDDTGAIVWKAHYSPFGTVTVDPGSTITNNLRFPGQYYDAETGLHYNWHRYYDPETGRYISADPIGLDGGINLYAYTGNDPVNAVDPEGKFAFTAVTGAVSIGYAVLQGIDLATHRYYQYQVAKELDRQILYTRQQLSETDKDDCERYHLLEEGLKQLVMQQAGLFEEAGAETILDAYQSAPDHVTPYTPR